MQEGELLSLQWKQVRWIQNEIYLSGVETKTKRDRRTPISLTLGKYPTRRQYGMTDGPNPERFQFGLDHYVFGDEAGQRIVDVKTAWENTVFDGAWREARAAGGRRILNRDAGEDRADRSPLPRSAPRGRQPETGSWLAAPRSQRIPQARDRDDDGALSERQGRLPQELIERKPLSLGR
jgi:hypothetical protein